MNKTTLYLSYGGHRKPLSLDELVLLHNALNEVVNGMDLADFATRLGAPRGKAEKLLKKTGAVLDALDETGDFGPAA